MSADSEAMKAVDRLALKLTKVVVPPHTRVVNGKLQHVDGYIMDREGSRKSETFQEQPETVEEYEAWLGRIMEGKTFSMSDSERSSFDETTFADPDDEALGQYAAVAYRYVNPFLRRGKFDEEDDTPAYEESEMGPLIKSLDKASRRNSLKEPVVVWRGGDATVFGSKEISDPQQLVGVEIEDDGFVSTSFNKEVALEFEGYARDYRKSYPEDDYAEPVLVSIRLPRGSRGAYLEGTESEFLLPRGQTYQVVEARRTEAGAYDDDGNPIQSIVVTLEVIPRG